jgi:hypothetical protein
VPERSQRRQTALGTPTKDWKNMGSSGNKKTTMAKLARENRLRERRLNKQAKKEARKQASSDHLNAPEGALEAAKAQETPPGPTQAALQPAVQPPAAADEDARGEAAPGSTVQEQPLDLGLGQAATIHPPR